MDLDTMLLQMNTWKRWAPEAAGKEAIAMLS